MILIVGLGNPGEKYIKTRHNLGFKIVDEFLKTTTHPRRGAPARREALASRPPSRFRRPLNKFPKFKFSKKFNSLISEGRLDGKKIILAKPQTFMNNSGKAVKLLTNFYKITRPGLVVVHDDIDLPLGEIRISKGRGAAGHKGVQSIIDGLKTKNFVRFRIGIKPKVPTFYAVALNMGKFVLQKFNKKEEKILKGVIKRTCQAIEVAIKEGVEKAMSKYNMIPIYE